MNGVFGYLNMMAKGKGTVGKHPAFWFGEPTQLDTFHWDEEQGNKKQVLFSVIETVSLILTFLWFFIWFRYFLGILSRTQAVWL